MITRGFHDGAFPQHVFKPDSVRVMNPCDLGNEKLVSEKCRVFVLHAGEMCMIVGSLALTPPVAKSRSSVAERSAPTTE